MNPLNPFFAIIIFSIAFLTAYLIQGKYKIIHTKTRFDNVDGLRGFMTLGVFIHHCAVWHQYLQTNNWEVPKSDLFNQIGLISVSLFFMITAFLFITKLLNASEGKFDWNAFFVSRVLRLAPMYLFSITILILIVLAVSDWEIKVGLTRFLKQVFHWSIFTILGKPAINAFEFTKVINAGVVWSLPFEWLFYFALPLISLFILKKKPSIFYILASLIFVSVFFARRGIDLYYLSSFAGGALAPFILKFGNKKTNYNTFLLSIIIIALLVLILFFVSPDTWICNMLVITIFNIIALGNNVFGILRSPALKLLGEISYSTYLIHGIIIFTIMYFVIGIDKAKELSPTIYCLIIMLITPIVVMVSFMGYKYIEKPFMGLSAKLNAKRSSP